MIETICYLVRHGKDDDSVRGGWSSSTLTKEGVQQSLDLANYIFEHQSTLNISRIFSSDLVRAKQTAEFISKKIDIPIEFREEFRETNNGSIAGISNSKAITIYPNMYWNSLEWDECYPNGESPKLFYDRIFTAWNEFSSGFSEETGNVILITHGGVINVILKIISQENYSNKDQAEKIPHTQLISIKLTNQKWYRL